MGALMTRLFPPATEPSPFADSRLRVDELAKLERDDPPTLSGVVTPRERRADSEGP